MRVATQRGRRQCQLAPYIIEVSSFLGTRHVHVVHVTHAVTRHGSTCGNF